jgi:hypothetical protein
LSDENWATKIEILQALLRYRVRFNYLCCVDDSWAVRQGIKSVIPGEIPNHVYQPIKFDKSRYFSAKDVSTDVSTGQTQHVSRIDEVVWPNQHRVPAVFISDFILDPEESATILNPSLVSSSSGRKKGLLLLHVHTISIRKRAGVSVISKSSRTQQVSICRPSRGWRPPYEPSKESVSMS